MTREFNFLKFAEVVSIQFEEAFAITNQFYENNPNFSQDQETLDLERLKNLNKQIQLKIEFAYDYLSLDKMFLTLQQQLSKFTDKFDEIAFVPIIDIGYSPVTLILHDHFEAIMCQFDSSKYKTNENINSWKLLEGILNNTPKYLKDHHLNPANEANVRNLIYKFLTYIFPDTIREVPISKVSKIFKPDIGIPQLKCAIEYKFVTSEKEMKTSIGGIFEDIKGYAGSNDWNKFYAVFYMTDHFMTLQQIEAEFKLAEVPHSWKPILTFGKGERNKSSK